MEGIVTRAVAVALLCAGGVQPAAGQAADGSVVLEDALVIGPVGRGRRSAVHTDAIEARIVAGTWSAPREGATVALPDGEARTWEAAAADEEGWLGVERGGYACFELESDRERVMILHARGHSLVYVNGALRAGDPYNTGYVRLPVPLEAGRNELLFRVGRGRLWARLAAPEAPVALDTGDLTLPDLVRGEAWSVQAAIVVINASAEPLDDLTITAGGDGLPELETAVPPIAPLTIRKVPLWCGGPVAPDRDECRLRVRLLRDARAVDEKTLVLRVVEPTDRHRRTFRSAVDGSLQYYAVTPMKATAESPERPALFLTLHGAGVEARGQAAAYAPKPWGHVVAPTNRRPFGFDWEDWGRLDALETLEHAARLYGVDPDHTYLTGHSMGGHGVWNFGATYPDRFAAIGPSAGWISFWSYGGAPGYEDPDPIEAMLLRAASDSDTLALSRNYLHSGVYILHGEKDDNVPAEQSRQMHDHLAAFHPDVVYHEEPGAGHWWGNRCVDWPPMFEFFASHRRAPAAGVDHVEFVTANPAVSARSRWVAIEAAQTQGEPASLTADRDRDARRFVVTTDNVARFALALDDLPAGAPIDVVVDGQSLAGLTPPPKAGRAWIARAGEGWQPLDGPVGAERKGPHRAGPFKHAFRNRMQFVYGTRGSAEENAWAYEKARFDAETFWYRGNGSVDLVRDVDFDADADRDRNVILYGNADSNAAWPSLLGESPVQVRRGHLTIARRRIDGADLACLFIRPRPGSDVASVGVVSGTGAPGMRLTGRLRYFLSGVAYPDLAVIGPEMLAEGVVGVRVAGFFGQDWSVEAGDIAWRE